MILCYHNVVRESGGPGDPGLHLPLGRFREQIAWLGRHFTLLPLAELHERARRGGSMRGLAALTFDDAYAGVLEHALPVLIAHDAPCTIFATGVGSDAAAPFWWDHPSIAAISEDATVRQLLLRDLQGDGAQILSHYGLERAALPVERLPVSWGRLREVAGARVAIGAHTLTHRALPTLSDDELERELRGSRDQVEQGVGHRPNAIAYPYGLSDARVHRAAERAGFTLGLTLGARDVTPFTPPLETPRVNVPASLSPAAFSAWISGLSHLRASRG